MFIYFLILHYFKFSNDINLFIIFSLQRVFNSGMVSHICMLFACYIYAILNIINNIVIKCLDAVNLMFWSIFLDGKPTLLLDVISKLIVFLNTIFFNRFEKKNIEKESFTSLLLLCHTVYWQKQWIKIVS